MFVHIPAPEQSGIEGLSEAQAVVVDGGLIEARPPIRFVSAILGLKITQLLRATTSYGQKLVTA